MNAQVLIDSIVRQMTVLLAQLATSKGLRAPLAHVANQVFVDLAREIESQGVSRKVAADMFGISLRSYQRKMHRLKESSTDRGRSLWEAVLDFISEQRIVTRGQVFERFPRDDEPQLRGVLRDLVDGGLVFRTGSGADALFRAATEEELGAASRGRAGSGLEELVWAVIYREGPLTRKQLADLVTADSDELERTVGRLTQAGRIAIEDGPAGPQYRSQRLVVEAGAPAGFEAAVYDHFHAMVKTICSRLAGDGDYEQWTGGSTYSFDLTPAHPLRGEVLQTLSEFRTRLSELRGRVNAHNARAGQSQPVERVVVYAGQCVIGEEPLDSSTGLEGAEA